MLGIKINRIYLLNSQQIDKGRVKMKIKIEKKHKDIYNKLIGNVNRTSKKFSPRKYRIYTEKYKKSLSKDNISIEKKKKELKNHLYDLIIKTFSIDLDKIKDKKIILEELKNNLNMLRELVVKIRSINQYLTDVLLNELDLTKGIDIKNLAKGKIREKEELKKEDIDKLEYLVYNMIKKIVTMDQKLLEKYKEQEETILKESKIETKDIEKVLRRETDILCHLEAKLPPASKTKRILLKKSVFTEWVARIFALISAFENEYRKEEIIFKKLKESSKIKKKIDTKIKHLVREKWYMLKLKNERLLSLKDIGRLDEEYHKLSYHYASASNL